jgi:hypothetical protein
MSYVKVTQRVYLLRKSSNQRTCHKQSKAHAHGCSTSLLGLDAFK